MEPFGNLNFFGLDVYFAPNCRYSSTDVGHRPPGCSSCGLVARTNNASNFGQSMYFNTFIRAIADLPPPAPPPKIIKSVSSSSQKIFCTGLAGPNTGLFPFFVDMLFFPFFLSHSMHRALSPLYRGRQNVAHALC